MTIAELISDYLDERERAGLKASSLRIYRTRLAPIIRAIGELDCESVSRRDWKKALHAATFSDAGKRLAPDTIGVTLTLVGSLQSFALDEELIRSPWLKKRDLEKPRSAGRERIATPEETARLLAAMDPAYRRLYQCLRLTGARRAELTAARIEDLERQPLRLVLEDHKSSRSGARRTIYIGTAAEALLAEAIGDRASGPIFLDAEGQPWRPDRVTKIFARIRARLGLPASLKLHATRHEFATRMVERFGIHAAAQACGHSNLSTTQRYAHLSGAYLSDCVSELFEDGSDRRAA